MKLQQNDRRRETARDPKNTTPSIKHGGGNVDEAGTRAWFVLYKDGCLGIFSCLVLINCPSICSVLDLHQHSNMAALQHEFHSGGEDKGVLLMSQEATVEQCIYYLALSDHFRVKAEKKHPPDLVLSSCGTFILEPADSLTLNCSLVFQSQPATPFPSQATSTTGLPRTNGKIAAVLNKMHWETCMKGGKPQFKPLLMSRVMKLYLLRHFMLQSETPSLTVSLIKLKVFIIEESCSVRRSTWNVHFRCFMLFNFSALSVSVYM